MSTCAYRRAARGGGGVTSRDPVEVQTLLQRATFLTSPQTFLHNVAAMCAVAVSPAGLKRQKVKNPQ